VVLPLIRIGWWPILRLPKIYALHPSVARAP
jgi:hypothetical protein